MVGCCAGSQGELVKGRSEDEEYADCPASGKGHLREALLLHEEALRVNRLMTRIVIRQQQRSFDSCYCPDITTLSILMITTRMCRELRKKDILSEVLRLSHDRSLNKYADVDDEDDFQVFWCSLRKVIMTSIL